MVAHTNFTTDEFLLFIIAHSKWQRLHCYFCTCYKSWFLIEGGGAP